MNNNTIQFKLLFNLILLLSLQVCAAREIKLTKTGGSPLIYNATNIPTTFTSVSGFITPTFSNK